MLNGLFSLLCSLGLHLGYILNIFLDCIPKTLTAFLMTIFREHLFSFWLSTLLWSSITRLSIHGGVMLLAGGSLSPPRSWFPSGCCTVWVSPLVHSDRWAKINKKLLFVCFYFYWNQYSSLLEDLHLMYSIWRPSFDQIREKSSWTAQLDLISWQHGVLVRRDKLEQLQIHWKLRHQGKFTLNVVHFKAVIPSLFPPKTKQCLLVTPW